MAKVTQLNINGANRAVHVDGDTSLLTVLRDHLDLTGSKFGCGEGQCGACTVLINGLPRRSCITPVGNVRDKQITTVEGLAANGRLHPVQQAFLEVGSFQCAYCTSGMMMTAIGLLKTNPNPTSSEIARFMQGNICRCGTYPRIIAAIQRAAKTMKEARA
jgi:isoquinoline 1-oxidoreductase subunit alpha